MFSDPWKSFYIPENVLTSRCVCVRVCMYVRTFYEFSVISREFCGFQKSNFLIPILSFLNLKWHIVLNLFLSFIWWKLAKSWIKSSGLRSFDKCLHGSAKIFMCTNRFLWFTNTPTYPQQYIHAPRFTSTQTYAHTQTQTHTNLTHIHTTTHSLLNTSHTQLPDTQLTHSSLSHTHTHIHTHIQNGHSPHKHIHTETNHWPQCVCVCVSCVWVFGSECLVVCMCVKFVCVCLSLGMVWV